MAMGAGSLKGTNNFLVAMYTPASFLALLLLLSNHESPVWNRFMGVVENTAALMSSIPQNPDR